MHCALRYAGITGEFCAAIGMLMNIFVVRENFNFMNRMFIGPCIIIIVEELETNLMSLVIFITLNICSTGFEH